MRTLHKRTALELLRPQLLWLLIALPSIAALAGAIIDFTSAFDIRQYNFSSDRCNNGCELSYTVFNPYGNIPIDFLQVATLFQSTQRISPDAISDTPPTLNWNNLFGFNASNCPGGYVMGIQLAPYDVEDFPKNSTNSSSCVRVLQFGHNEYGSLTGVVLDSPSAVLDARMQSITVTLHFPPLSAGSAMVQFILVSPVYVALRSIFQIALLVVTILFLIVYCRSLRVSWKTAVTSHVPERVNCGFSASSILLISITFIVFARQAYCVMLLIFLLIWLNPLSVLHDFLAPLLILTSRFEGEKWVMRALSYTYIFETFCAVVGFQGILFSLLCIAHGITDGVQIEKGPPGSEILSRALPPTKWNEEIQENSADLKEQRTQSSALESASFLEHAEDALTESKFEEWDALLLSSTVTTRVPWHSSNSPKFWSFLWPKLMIFLLGVALAALKYSLRFPAILNIPYGSVQQQELVDVLYTVLSFSIFILNCCWITWLYQAFAACVYKFATPPASLVHLGASNKMDPNGNDVYARISTRLVSYQASLWFLVCFVFLLYWLHCSGWASGLSSLFTSPLVTSFYSGHDDGDYSHKVAFYNGYKSSHGVRESYFFLNTTSATVASKEYPFHGMRRYLIYLAHAMYVTLINLCRFWSIAPSFTMMLLFTSMCYSICFSFAPPGVNFKDLLPSRVRRFLFGSDVISYHERQNTSLATHYIAEVIGIAEERACSYGAVSGHLSSSSVAQPNDHLFCLESACFLLECSWQTYFKSSITRSQHIEDITHVPSLDHSQVAEDKGDGSWFGLANFAMSSRNEIDQGLEGLQNTASLQDTFGLNLEDFDMWGLSTPRDLDSLNLQLISEIESKELQLSSFVAARQSEKLIVVAFRGTSGYHNVKTDLMFNQILMPDLTLQQQQSAVSNSIVSKETDALADEILQIFLFPPQVAKSEVLADGCDMEVDVDPNVLQAEPRIFKEFKERIAKGMSNLSRRFQSSSKARIHAGFWIAYSSMRRQLYASVIKALVLLVRNNKYDKGKSSLLGSIHIQLTGHSLGGALASLAALDLSENMSVINTGMVNVFRGRDGTISRSPGGEIDDRDILPSIELYTFGAPRVGNKKFKEIFECKVPSSFRVEVNGDMICRTPMLAGYRHAACTPVLICDALASPSSISLFGNSQQKWWDARYACGQVSHCTSLLISPTYSQFLLIRKHTGSPEYHSLTAYRNYLESLFAEDEQKRYAQKYGASCRARVRRRSSDPPNK